MDGAGRVLRNAEATPFTFTILLQQGQNEAVANIFVDALRQLGIEARVSSSTRRSSSRARATMTTT